MKTGLAVKIVLAGLLAYAGLVVAVEATLGFFQPEDESTFVITTMDEDGVAMDRVLARNQSGGRLYAAANHWPRAWYHQALKNPRVQATVDGVRADYIAVPVDGGEHEQVEAENANRIVLKILFGFAPRRFLRLDPVVGGDLREPRS